MLIAGAVITLGSVSGISVSSKERARGYPPISLGHYAPHSGMAEQFASGQKGTSPSICQLH